MLHERGYTYNGDASIGGLTPHEVTVIQHGQHVRSKLREQKTTQAKSSRKYSARKPVDEQLSEYDQKVRDSRN